MGEEEVDLSRSRQQEVEVEEEEVTKKTLVVGVHAAVIANLGFVELAQVEDSKSLQFAHHASHRWPRQAV
jgi:hypothetical protein